MGKKWFNPAWKGKTISYISWKHAHTMVVLLCLGLWSPTHVSKHVSHASRETFYKFLMQILRHVLFQFFKQTKANQNFCWFLFYLRILELNATEKHREKGKLKLSYSGSREKGSRLLAQPIISRRNFVHVAPLYPLIEF